MAASSESVDAFILFNEREESVREIESRLVNAGIKTYMWRRDIPAGADWQQVEMDYLLRAKTVLVFLGPAGWGRTHERLVDESMRLEKSIIPVTIGTVAIDNFQKGRGIFHRLRRVELAGPSDSQLEGLIERLRAAPQPSDHQFDAIIKTIVDGGDADRLRSVQRIRSLSDLQRIRLASRIRSELTGRFNASKVAEISTAVRDPGLIPGIRSWLFSALVWSDAASEASEVLIRSELEGDNESSRFWLLSGLLHVKPRYLEEVAKKIALAKFDGASSLLARAILSPTDPELLTEYGSRLASGDFGQAWPVLRVMRVIPLFGLVSHACKLFLTSPTSTPSAYDALYALCGVAPEAAELLTVEPGVHDTLARIVEIIRLANEVAVMNFAVLVAAFSSDDVEGAMSELERQPGNTQIVRQLRAQIREYQQRAGTGLRSLAGFLSDDINTSHDFLGFDEDVQTLTSVMMASAVKPPIAIGLFGDWGTGKTHFMESMIEAVKTLSERAAASDAPVYCREVVQIRFNAWHYTDTNLWASLVSHILEQLAAYVSPSQSPEEQHQALLQELTSAKDLLTQANAEKSRVSTEVSDRASELKGIRTEREAKEVRLRDLRLNDLRLLLEQDPKAKAAMEKALADLGVPTVLNSIADLSSAVRESRNIVSRASTLLGAIITIRSPATYLLLAFAIFGIPAIVWLLVHNQLDSVYTHASAVLGGIVAIVTAVKGPLAKANQAVKEKIDALEQAKSQVDKLIAQKRQESNDEEAQLQGEIAELGAKERQATSRYAAAAARVAELEDRVRSITEERSLTRFLSDRSRADDYRKNLGLISVIRKDLEGLRERLFQPPAEGKKRVERVVLYIDDLDRCPSSTVMDVLQAVHLLLAYDLFVVVVGVDPRWLLRSLEKAHDVFIDDDSGSEGWRTTPQNYLEKIFQIPYCLPAMTKDGFGRMVSYELVHRPPAPKSDVNAIAVTTTDMPPGIEVKLDETSPQAPSGAELQMDEKTANKLGGETRARTFEVTPEALVVREWESGFAEEFATLIGTPRAVKRFANIYRMLKASVDPAALLEYEGTADAPGDFRVPMFLLAMLIGDPSASAALFPQLLRIAARDGDVIEMLRTAHGPDGLGRSSLPPHIGELIRQSDFPHEPKIYAHWLPRVARFSFEVGSALSLDRKRGVEIASAEGE